MNCTQALEQLLEADLDAPSTGQDRALAAHIAGCGRCARAATALQSGTMALAQAQAQAVSRERVAAVRLVVAPRGIGWFAPRFALAAGALAAVGVVFSRGAIPAPPLPASPAATAAVVPPRATPASPRTAASPRATDAAAVAPRAAAVVGESVRPAHRTPRSTQAPRAAEYAPARIEPIFFVSEPMKLAAVEATPFTLSNAANALPVTLENRADAARLPEITVVNRLGTHAMVSRTADPNIVVVWLSAEPNRRIP